MIDVPRREIICLDSQIEKINHLRPHFNFIMGRFQTELIRRNSSLSLSPSLSLSAAARICLPWLSLGDCSCVPGRELDLGLLLGTLPVLGTWSWCLKDARLLPRGRPRVAVPALSPWWPQTLAPLLSV